MKYIAASLATKWEKSYSEMVSFVRTKLAMFGSGYKTILDKSIVNEGTTEVRAITERGIRCHLRYNILGGTCKHRCFYLPSFVRALPPTKHLVSLASQTYLVVRYVRQGTRKTYLGSTSGYFGHFTNLTWVEPNQIAGRCFIMCQLHHNVYSTAYTCNEEMALNNITIYQSNSVQLTAVVAHRHLGYAQLREL